MEDTHDMLGLLPFSGYIFAESLRCGQTRNEGLLRAPELVSLRTAFRFRRVLDGHHGITSSPLPSPHLTHCNARSSPHLISSHLISLPNTLFPCFPSFPLINPHPNRPIPIRPPHPLPTHKPLQLPNLSPLLRLLERFLARPPGSLSVGGAHRDEDALVADGAVA